MRVIVTRLLDRGYVRDKRAQPIDGHLSTRLDDQGRRIAQMTSSPDDLRPICENLVHATIGEVGLRTFILHGLERCDDGRVVAQAWECEPAVRR